MMTKKRLKSIKKTWKKNHVNNVDNSESIVINKNTIFNLANLLTSLRIIFAPFVLLALLKNDYNTALILFAIASFTDIFDGKIARMLNVGSKFGAILDPIADVTLMVFTIIGLILKTGFPSWFVAIVLMREIIIIIGGILCLHTKNVSLAKADVVGKLSRFLQVASLLLFLLYLYDPIFFAASYAAIYCAALFTLASTVIYISRVGTIIKSYKINKNKSN